ncbi:unnamed protein product [Discula destructiva]
MGKTLADKLRPPGPSLDPGQKIMRPLGDHHLRRRAIFARAARQPSLPQAAVAKITGREGLSFTGKARVFDKEHESRRGAQGAATSRPPTANLVLIVRYEGPRGEPGMPEQLTASAAIMGAGLTSVALVTDGRYSGASHGFIRRAYLSRGSCWGPYRSCEGW